VNLRAWWASVALSAGSVPWLIAGDQAILDGVRNASPIWIVGLMQWVTWLGHGAVDIGIPVAIGLAAWRRGGRAALHRGLAGGGAVAAAGLADQILKNLLCRARPSAAMAGAFLVGFPCVPAPYALASFPSGHATTAFALATLLGIWYPGWRWPALLLAGGVGLSRVVLGSHFPSDVIAGGVLGAAVALAAAQFIPGVRRCRSGEGDQ
jgi:undecaprenyl-diphosphatase